jgi:thiamine-phosphate pyrophosphorylase
MYSRLQYISSGATANEQLANIQAALDAGCKWIQLRYKNALQGEIKVLSETVNDICKSYKATFIINDFPDMAAQIDADGFHLGLQDMDIELARELYGKEKIIGGTANTLKDVLQRVEEGCDYIGLGPYRFTTTKEKLSPVLGLAGYETIMEELHKRGINTPVYAIGGIETDDISALMNTGIYGIAVSGMITRNSDKKYLIEELNTLLNGKPNYC